jgi:glycine betaine/proline transport system permease protein
MPILDFMQTLPPFVYLIPAITYFGLGSTSALFSTVIFAMPPAIRLTTLGIQHVPEELVEAVDSFGSTKWQKLVKLQLPLAAPSIMAGVNQTILLALSMVVIAAMIGAGGLGGVVWKAIQRLKPGMGFEAGIAIVIIAIILDRVLRNAKAAETSKPKVESN